MNTQTLQEDLDNVEKARQDLKDSLRDATTYFEERIKRLIDMIRELSKETSINLK